MTSPRSLAWSLSIVSISWMSGLGAHASAQSYFEYGDSCRALEPCPGTGLDCPDGQHEVMILAECYCASGREPSLGAPTLCCSSERRCPGAATCTVPSDGLEDAGICTLPDLNLCAPAGEPTTNAQLRDCFTLPGAGTLQPYWVRGDCDGDGIPNGEETRTGRDPCSCATEDLSCCLSASTSDPRACCDALSADTATACCFAHDGSPDVCCDGRDPVSCCADLGMPEALACCEELATDDLTCCPFEDDPAACCLDAGGAPSQCCALAGADDEDACDEVDASTDRDAGGRDGGNLPFDGGADDAGSSTSDGGAAAMDAGDDTQFGGGGGCVCSTSSRAPSPLALLTTALGIVIPIFRRRSR